MRLGVLGANGFIGNRAVEMLRESFDVRAIVRRPAAAALPRRFDLDVRVADALDRGALQAAFDGCDAVLVSIAGGPATIVGAIQPICAAARDAGVDRLVYLSSASVHGQAPGPGIDERSPLSERQPLAYNNAKVAAERRLLRATSSGGPEVVILRPGIVFGPRSQWVGAWADEVLAGEAYVVDGADGLCNAIYVDDVVRAAVLALQRPGIHGRAYLLGQAERVTWRQLYAPVSSALGVNFDALPDHPFESAQPEPRTTAAAKAFSTLKQLAPKSLRVGFRAAMRHRRGPPPPILAEAGVSIERALLHTARHVPSWSRAQAELGYEPSVTFDEGVRRSIGWLAFAGYPVGTTRTP